MTAELFWPSHSLSANTGRALINQWLQKHWEKEKHEKMHSEEENIRKEIPEL
jgi:hypothetical protein